MFDWMGFSSVVGSHYSKHRFSKLYFIWCYEVVFGLAYIDIKYF